MNTTKTNGNPLGLTPGGSSASSVNLLPPNRLAKPSIPEWLKRIICSRTTSKGERITKRMKRDAIEAAIQVSEEFVMWAVLALYDEQTKSEKRNKESNVRNKRGFTFFDAYGFSCMATRLLKDGDLGMRDYEKCRTRGKKGRSRLGRYGEQLIYLIAKANCLVCVPQKFRKREQRLANASKEAA
jgi:hypothetical protein